MIRDRGRIKWTSMMLPEHVKMLRDWAQEDEYEPEREMDEQQLELMNETILEAMEYNRAVAVTYYDYGKQRYEKAAGKIHFLDGMEKRLLIVDRHGEVRRIMLEKITDIRFSDGEGGA